VKNCSRRGVIWSICTGALISISGCGIGETSSAIAYRMTVEVDTPVGARSGSSVFWVETRAGRRLGDNPGIKYRIRSEAVSVQLPSGILFALPLNESAGPDYPARLLHRGLERGVVTPPLSRAFVAGEWLEMEAEARRVRPRIVLDSRDYPTLVRFTDLSDPRSVVKVNPSDLTQFGPGVRLRRILISVTDDQPTAEIVKLLPWLPKYRDRTFLGNRSAKPGVLADELRAGFFTTEIGK
jgi:hypothetical protein